MKAPLVAAVVQHHVEAAGHGDDELVQGLVRMPPALRAAGHVVEVIDALSCTPWRLATVQSGVGIQ